MAIRRWWGQVWGGASLVIGGSASISVSQPRLEKSVQDQNGSSGWIPLALESGQGHETKNPTTKVMDKWETGSQPGPWPGMPEATTAKGHAPSGAKSRSHAKDRGQPISCGALLLRAVPEGCPYQVVECGSVVYGH
ncbi:unnamed protein product [Pleuronectes platessa]|uniref:Uncharacterized protein n=1 Tax=Pleuronectes platessa TaxID=8262 RepID=A0A9N7UUR4_PLEPL|nr:unnamed protein product [Pleuronectes platessa]